MVCISYLLVQAKQINGGGELYRQKYPKLRVRLVDGSGLATAVLLKSIPQDAKQVYLHAGPSKIACATATALCGRGVQVYLYHPANPCCLFYLLCMFLHEHFLKRPAMFSGPGYHDRKEGI
jgi:ActR/RegA family two-component response regulator